MQRNRLLFAVPVVSAILVGATSIVGVFDSSANDSIQGKSIEPVAEVVSARVKEQSLPSVTSDDRLVVTVPRRANSGSAGDFVAGAIIGGLVGHAATQNQLRKRALGGDKPVYKNKSHPCSQLQTGKVLCGNIISYNIVTREFNIGATTYPKVEDYSSVDHCMRGKTGERLGNLQQMLLNNTGSPHSTYFQPYGEAGVHACPS